MDLQMSNLDCYCTRHNIEQYRIVFNKPIKTNCHCNFSNVCRCTKYFEMYDIRRTFNQMVQKFSKIITIIDKDEVAFSFTISVEEDVDKYIPFCTFKTHNGNDGFKYNVLLTRVRDGKYYVVSVKFLDRNVWSISNIFRKTKIKIVPGKIKKKLL